MINILPLFGPIGPEMFLIVFILVLLFGADRVPKLARSTRQGINKVKKGRKDLEEEVREISNPDTNPTPEETTNTEPVVEDDSKSETEKTN